MAKKQPTEKELVRTSIDLDRHVFNKLKNVSDITGRTYKEIVDQALRGLLGIPTPTIKEQIKKIKGEKIKWMN